jgi:hypothetical protein
MLLGPPKKCETQVRGGRPEAASAQAVGLVTNVVLDAVVAEQSVARFALDAALAIGQSLL